MIALGQSYKHLMDKSRFVSLAAMGNRGHIRAVGLKHNTIQRHSARQSFWQIRLLEGEHTTYAKDKSVKLQQFLCLMGISCEAVVHTATEVCLIPF